MKDVLAAATITMDRTVARIAFLDYRHEVRKRHNAEDEQIMRGYQAMAMGKQLINLREVIGAGGEFENGLPKLAVMQSDLKFCYVERTRNGAVRFLPKDSWSLAHNRRKGVFALPGGTLSTRDTGSWSDWSGNRCRSMVPIVPPALRPATALSNYTTLYEVDKWEPAPRPPGDPALLKHIGGELYAVVAIWDLSRLEQAVLSARVL